MRQITRGARRIWVLFASVVALGILIGASPASACVGDCNNNGVVAVNELIIGVNIALGSQPLSNCPSFDAGGNSKADINELIQGVNNALNGCTGAACSSSAEVRLAVVNRSGASKTVTLDGSLAKYTCCPGNFATDYTQSLTLPAPSDCSDLSCTCSVGTCSCDSTTVPRCTVSITTRNPGEWKHGISVTSTGQKQYQRSSVVAGTVNDTTWTVFATVKSVTPIYALANAITAANTATAPVLIQFDHSQFSQGVADNTLMGTALVPEIAISNEIVIDGTNSLGNPSSLDDFRTRVYPTIITLNPTAPTANNAATMKLAAKVGLIGLDIRRILGNDSGIQSADQPTVWLAGSSAASFIRNSRIDGGAASRGNTCNGGNKTCIYANDIASTGFANAAVVEQTEVRHCFGRAASINKGHLSIHDSWMHHNRTGGALANANNGKLQLARNLMEDDGKNCPSAMICSGGSACTVTSSCPNSNGCPSGETCQLDPDYSNDPAACDTTFTAVNLQEVLVQDTTEGANAARLETDGDIVRDTSGQGIVLKENAEADIKNTYICGMQDYGIEVHHDPTPPPTPNVNMNVSGSAMAFNKRGVQIYRSQDNAKPGVISFGNTSATPNPSNPGNNAFAMNGGDNDNFSYSDRSGGLTRYAQNSQWEHCGTGSSCVGVNTLKSKDVRENAGPVGIGTPQPQRNPGALSIDSVSPKKVTRRGAIVTIVGAGFNAIDGYNVFPTRTATPVGPTPTPGGPTPTPAGANCDRLAEGNTCSPLQGMCVEFKDDNNNWIPADDVLSVTPTTIVVRSSIACSKTTSIRVTRQDNAVPNGTFEFTNQFCIN